MALSVQSLAAGWTISEVQILRAERDFLFSASVQTDSGVQLAFCAVGNGAHYQVGKRLGRSFDHPQPWTAKVNLECLLGMLRNTFTLPLHTWALYVGTDPSTAWADTRCFIIHSCTSVQAYWVSEWQYLQLKMHVDPNIPIEFVSTRWYAKWKHGHIQSLQNAVSFWKI
jgi:hypothetical protein